MMQHCLQVIYNTKFNLKIEIMNGAQLIRDTALLEQPALSKYIGKSIWPFLKRLMLKYVKRLLAKLTRMKILDKRVSMAFLAGMLLSKLA